MNVIFITGAFNRLEREVSRKSPANEVRNGGSKRVDEDEKGEKEAASEDKESFWNLSASFKIVEDWVLVELKRKQS